MKVKELKSLLECIPDDYDVVGFLETENQEGDIVSTEDITLGNNEDNAVYLSMLIPKDEIEYMMANS